MGGSPAIHLHVNNAFEKAPATIQKLDQLANNQSNRLSLCSKHAQWGKFLRKENDSVLLPVVM